MVDDVPAFGVRFWPMESNKKFSDLVVTNQIWQSFQQNSLLPHLSMLVSTTSSCKIP